VERGKKAERGEPEEAKNRKVKFCIGECQKSDFYPRVGELRPVDRRKEGAEISL